MGRAGRGAAVVSCNGSICIVFTSSSDDGMLLVYTTCMTLLRLYTLIFGCNTQRANLQSQQADGAAGSAGAAYAALLVALPPQMCVLCR